MPGPIPDKPEHLPCGHSKEHGKTLVGGSVLVCQTDNREWQWIPGHWKEFKTRPKKVLTVQASSPSA